MLSGGPLGLMAAAMDVVMPYVHERHQFGEAIGSFQLIQPRSPTCTSAWRLPRLCLCRGARLRPWPHHPPDAAGAILYAAEKATWLTGQAIQILGGNGYINEYPTGRLWRDAKLYEIGAGTSEIRRMLIGRELFQRTL